MTPDDIRSQRFNTRLLHGLSPEEVGAFLEDVAEAFANVQDLNAALTAQVTALEEEIQTLAAREAAPARPAEAPAPDQLEELRSAVLKEVEALVRNAHLQADAILREAEAMKAHRQAEAEELLASARAREAEIRDEIDHLAARHLQVVDDVRATLDAYSQWLSTVDPRGRARGRREALSADGAPDSVSAASESTVG